MPYGEPRVCTGVSIEGGSRRGRSWRTWGEECENQNIAGPAISVLKSDALENASARPSS